MEELSLKDLKAVLDDNELDLSMRQLTVIPTRALAKLPRATHIDFSNNQILTIPPEFCLLTHITKLDLSNNRIVHLPNDFGKLVNLEHLDLYKNSIEELPLSFGELKSLKWLDVKGNPLQAELAKVAGECQSEKDCKIAAIKVVKFMKNEADEKERLLQKQKELNKQHEKQTNAVTTPQTGAMASKEKAKKKKHKHKETNANNTSINTQNQSEGPRMQKQSKETPNRTYAPNKPTSQSCLSRVFGLIRKLMMLLVIVTLVGIALSSFIIFDNCSQESHHWIPSSQPFCDDLHKLIQHRKLSTTFTKNLYQTLSSMGWVYMAKLREVQSDIEEGGFIEKIQYYCSSFYTKLVTVAFVVQKYASEWFAALQKWYSENASDYVADFVDNVVIALKMLLIIFSDFAVFIVEKGSTAIMTLSDNVVYYMEHRDELLRTIEHWWINLK